MAFLITSQYSVVYAYVRLMYQLVGLGFLCGWMISFFHEWWGCLETFKCVHWSMGVLGGSGVACPLLGFPNWESCWKSTVRLWCPQTLEKEELHQGTQRISMNWDCPEEHRMCSCSSWRTQILRLHRSYSDSWLPFVLFWCKYKWLD